MTDPLQKSTPDDVMLAFKVEEKFIEICGLYERINHLALVPPIHLNAAMVRWRRLCVRHKSGDYRHSKSEIAATQDIADWTLIMNAELRGQKQIQKVDWR